MQFKQETILTLFDSSQKSYVIPVYQRAYSWEEDQWKAFLEDLVEQTEGENNYFYGNILLEVIKKGKEYEIIDGQQRLTTLTIFIRSLLNVLFTRKENGENFNIDFEEKEKIYFENNGNRKLRPVDYDRGFYDTVIIENRNTSSSSESQNRILEAKKYFIKSLKEYNTEKLLKLFEKLEETEITSIELEGKKDSALMFELQNNRGKSLTNMERLKSFFMYQLYVHSKTEEVETNVTYISDLYKSIYLIINKLTIFDEDSVLNYHCQAWLKGYPYRNIDEVKEYIKKSNNKVSDIKDFVLELKDSFDSIIKYQNTCLENGKKLRSCKPPVWVYPFILRGYKKIEEDNETELNRLFKILEIMVYRDRISNTRADIHGRINSIMREYDGNNDSLRDNIENKFNEEYYWSYNRMKDQINGYMYQNPVINYTLWEYEKSIQNKGYKINEVSISDESIEHISPQTPTDENETLESGYDVTEDNVYSDEFIEKYLNCIGNLMIISQSHNSSIGNKAFSEKLKSYNSNPLLNQQAEIKNFLTNDKIEWKKDSIKKRKKVIVDFVLKNWNLNNV